MIHIDDIREEAKDDKWFDFCQAEVDKLKSNLGSLQQQLAQQLADTYNKTFVRVFQLNLENLDEINNQLNQFEVNINNKTSLRAQVKILKFRSQLVDPSFRELAEPITANDILKQNYIYDINKYNEIVPSDLLDDISDNKLLNSIVSQHNIDASNECFCNLIEIVMYLTEEFKDTAQIMYTHEDYIKDCQ